jgi:hypothetical protein
MVAGDERVGIPHPELPSQVTTAVAVRPVTRSDRVEVAVMLHPAPEPVASLTWTAWTAARVPVAP